MTAPALCRPSIVLLLSLLCLACDEDGSSLLRDIHTTRCITDVSAFERHSYACDGVEFKVLLTQECIDRACGLIVDVHGWASNPEQQESRSNLARAAMNNGGYIVVQPGQGGTPPSWDSAVHNAIVFDFLQQAIDGFDVDADRVHFTGFSQGGWMTWNFVCDYSEIIASAAPLAAPASGCFLGGDGPARKVPILLTSGVNDLAVRYYTTDSPLSIAATLVSVMFDYDMVTEDYVSYDFSEVGDIVTGTSGAIDSVNEGVQFEILDGSADGSFLWTRYTGSDGSVFEHLRHSNNHVYPDNPDSPIFEEEPSVWFPVGEAILQFFIDNPRRGP